MFVFLEILKIRFPHTDSTGSNSVHSQIFSEHGLLELEMGGGGGMAGGTRIGQALIVINVYILPQRTQNPETAGKKCVIWVLYFFSPIELLTNFQSFFADFPQTLIAIFVFFN